MKSWNIRELEIVKDEAKKHGMREKLALQDHIAEGEEKDSQELLIGV